MRIHILGICGTFMGGVALLARQLGYEVEGSDSDVYPPMSTLLRDQGVRIHDGYLAEHLNPVPDLVVIGNALSRGNPAVEQVLNAGLPYTSGPAFLAQYVLAGRWVLAVAGTHGKTTTSSILAWILEFAGMQPGFLIGGIAANFGLSARLGASDFFVVEADEYDSAFFDKRSKFVHYRPRTLIANNLEFDHADIFPDLNAIQQQFHYLIRTVPANGLIIAPAVDRNLTEVFDRGIWTPLQRFWVDSATEASGSWGVRNVAEDFGQFDLYHDGKSLGTVRTPMQGAHNVYNLTAAILAARHAGVPVHTAIEAMTDFAGVKRRMELRGSPRAVSIYDDFAHHPTAIRSTLDGLRSRIGGQRLIAVVEMRSNTMKMGVHKEELPAAFHAADEVILFQSSGLQWDLREVSERISMKSRVFDRTDDIIEYLRKTVSAGDHVVIMSNGGFERLHERLIEALGSDDE